jgi:NADPH:quinone reductase-like Zn-dependent oxidoreductase
MKILINTCITGGPTFDVIYDTEVDPDWNESLVSVIQDRVSLFMKEMRSKTEHMKLRTPGKEPQLVVSGINLNISLIIDKEEDECEER